MDARCAELAAAIVEHHGGVLDEHSLVVGWKEIVEDQVPYLKLSVSFGIGGIKQFRTPISDLEELLGNFRGLDEVDWRAPKTGDLGPAVEQLVDLSYMEEIIDLHDPDADLEQYVHNEPKPLRFYLPRVEKSKGEGV